MNDQLGDRMKNNYENRSRYKLTRRTPVIMRLDGRAFHTVTRECQKPFDIVFATCMVSTAQELIGEIQGAKLAYVQSDEISILITDFDRLTTDAWFDYNIQKMTSISAGIASAIFSKLRYTHPDAYNEKIAVFDCRVFNIPKEEVCNYFVWRQKDWIRNSVQMLAQSKFSHKQLDKKSQADMHEMLYTQNINWADLSPIWKNGTLIETNNISLNFTTIFTENREVVEKYLVGE
jgi:tRNA(His) 5'-end guanylyltransferase